MPCFFPFCDDVIDLRPSRFPGVDTSLPIEELRVREETSEVLSIVTSDDRPYTTENNSSSNASDSSSNNEDQSLRRLKLNEFLSVSGKGAISQPKKSWDQLSTQTKTVRILKAKDAVVASLEVTAPGNPASLWEVLKSSQSVEAALCITAQTSADQKYLEALADLSKHQQLGHTPTGIISNS